MYRWFVLAMALLTGSTAAAGGLSGSAPEPLEAPLVSAAKPKSPTDLVEEKVKEQSEEEKKAQERLKAIEAAESQMASRVVVLKWPESDTDHTNDTLLRNIRTRIARPEAKFYPEIDLYQSGRKEPDKTIRPIDQRAVVPDDAVERILDAVDEVSTIPWNALSDQDWGLKAYELRELAKELWFIDRPELREPLFMLYTQIGYAAENSNNPSPPFFEAIGGKPVNYYWYLAGSMANEEPGLMSKLTDQERYASINYYKDALDQGQFPAMTLSFELEGRWDPKSFASEYQVFINGLERVITSPDGLQNLNPGRVDVYLARGDGHSLSDSVQLDKLDGKVYFVRDVARKRMGKDFIDMLMLHPFECSPQVEGDILNYLSIYAKLHPEADIYVGLAKGGSIASRNIYLWRWDRVSATLQKVLDDTGGFPVRFVGLVGTGAIFGGAGVTAVTPEEVSAYAEGAQPGTDPAQLAAGAKDTFIPDISPTLSGVPIAYHLRGHYGRLMVTTGLEFAYRTEGNWQDLYQTQTIRGPDHQLTLEDEVEVPIECPDPTQEGCTATETVPFDVMRERKWQRLVFLGVGVVLGRNAAIGFGPRGFIRTGWYNAPHTVDLTAHLGHAALAPFAKNAKNGKGATGRVRPILDADFYGGVMIPFRDSFLVAGTNKLGKPIPTFGTTLTAGLTF